MEAKPHDVVAESYREDVEIEGLRDDSACLGGVLVELGVQCEGGESELQGYELADALFLFFIANLHLLLWVVLSR